MMMMMVVVTFEAEDLKASLDFFKIPGKTSESLLRLKGYGECGNDADDEVVGSRLDYFCIYVSVMIIPPRK